MGTRTEVTPPPPRRGGTRIMCPMVDVTRTEATGELTMCPETWPDTARGRYRYRRHWRTWHWAPFTSETHAVMEMLTKGNWLGYRGVSALIRVTK